MRNWMTGASRSVSEARVVVGLDFGTTYSGYAYAHKSDPSAIYTFYEWPGASKPYCKTITGIYYKPAAAAAADGGHSLVNPSWGYRARTEYEKDSAAARRLLRRSVSDSDDMQQPVLGTYLTRFKLHLAGNDAGYSSAPDLPPGFTVNDVISDYLRQIGRHILNRLQDSYGSQMSMEFVQWCVTVPSIWSDNAKRQMKACMINAGLVTDQVAANGRQLDAGSPHPLIMVLEPEAAACYCHRSIRQLGLKQGDKLLVADIGGGTTDIVVQEWVGNDEIFKVKEVTRSTGGLCGGTYVDRHFMIHLCERIGCLGKYLEQYPEYVPQLLNMWEGVKCSFGDPSTIGDDIELRLSRKLADAWQEYEEGLGLPEREAYDEIQLSHSDMKSIFDPVVEQNLDLIADQLSQTNGNTVMLVVGGFASSPYLMTKIKERFRDQVRQIISPPNPGSAICQGAVALAMNPNGIVSRVARKTYGIEILPDFVEGVDPPEYHAYINGVKKCKNKFEIFIQKNTVVEIDHSITKYFDMFSKVLSIKLFSSDEVSPKYITGESCRLEGELMIDISQSHRSSKHDVGLCVSMYFGKSCIEVKAQIVDPKKVRAFGSGERKMEVPIAF
ncbi:hypothetical protein CY35_15G009300 [Sphagnum magellanicum]|nr:hypothetical protein CY35_15G009300 [Sphagnum magellanicum]